MQRQPASFREFHCSKHVLGSTDLYALSKNQEELWLNFMLKKLLLIETLCLSYQGSPLLRGLLLSRNTSFSNWPMPKLQLQTSSEGEFFKQTDGIKGRNGCVGV